MKLFHHPKIFEISFFNIENQNHDIIRLLPLRGRPRANSNKAFDIVFYFRNLYHNKFTNPMKEMIEPATNWLAENWLLVALVISEIAAFVPKKVNGILQGLLRIGGKLFEKKVSKSQNF